MILEEILKKIEYIDYKKQNDFEITNITNSSKNMDNRDTFIAVVGNLSDGHKYIDNAIEKGAKTIIHEKDIDYKDGINYIKVKSSRETLALLSNILTDYPSKKMTVIGVTGTNGKTTTATTIYRLMTEIYGAATNIGTDGCFIGKDRTDTENTTPDVFLLNEIFKRSLDKGINKVVLEASSHGLYQKRLDGIDFDYGIFNNLSTEHLDYHKTMDEYFNAKMKLFDMANTLITNVDDEYGRLAKERYPVALTYGIENEADYQAIDIKKANNKITFKVQGVDFILNTIADYNVYNALAAIATLHHMGNDLAVIAEKMAKFKGLPSRFEFVDNDLDKNIVIDFAHTPRAYEAIFKSIPEGADTIAVFGVNGDRNTEFRHLIGNVCAENGVFAVITTDDPKFDTYENITREIIEGIEEKGGAYEQIKDRKEAMKYAIEKAKPGDYVLMLGKGQENFLKLNGNEKTPYNEHQTVLEAIKEL